MGVTEPRLVTGSGHSGSTVVAGGACAPVAVRLNDIEGALNGCSWAGAKEKWRASKPDIMAALSPIDDVRGTAGYRREAAAELVTRLVGRLCEETA